MQDDVEVLFCEICGTSVSVGDLAAGVALRHHGKVLGSCCLPSLRGAASVVSPTPVAVAPRAESRVMPALMVLAGVAAAAIFVDHRSSVALAALQKDSARLGEAQVADSQVLAGLAVAMDAMPRRSELDGLVVHVRELAGALERARSESQEQWTALAREIAGVATAQRAQADQAIDYRPLFEDLRQRQVRLLEIVATLRAVAPPAPSDNATPEPVAGPDENAAPSLPPALAEQVRKLQAPDPAARFEAVDELLRSKHAAVLVHLLPMTKDADAFVRRLTVEGLAEWRRPETVEALLAAMADGDERVRDTAWRSLREVSGQKLAFESAAAKDVRARALQKWQDWWAKNKDTFGS